MKTPLLEQLKQAYSDRPDILGLVDESVQDALGLSILELKVIVALLLAEGDYYAAHELLPEMRQNAYNATLRSLAARELVAVPVDSNQVKLDGLERALKMQTPDEVEEVEAEAPSVKLKLRPLREQVVLLARSANSPVRGVAKAFVFIFGETYQGKNFWPTIGLYARELGADRAALFFLEHANDALQNPLVELIPLARAEAKGFRPVDVPSEEDEREGLNALVEEAWRKRVKMWSVIADKELSPDDVEQRRKDLALWERRGRPEL
jgi:hypothetical protein